MKAGRKPLPKRKLRSKIIMVRVTGEEYGQLVRAAKRSEQSPSEFVRAAALKTAKRRKA